MHKCAAFGLVLVCALIGCQSNPDESAPLVLHGARDKDDPAVVVVRQGRSLYCTGTVVGPRHVLTAAHCFDKGTRAVAVSTRSTFGGPWKSATRVHIAPGWSPGAWANDIAIVELADPIGVTPVPVNVDHAAVRGIDELRMVGYGRTATNRNNAGTKRTAEVAVRREPVFFATKPGAGVCFGDSGGPSLAMIGGVETVVAVNSHVIHANDCEHGSRVVRTDVHRAFLARFLDLPSAPPPPHRPRASKFRRT